MIGRAMARLWNLLTLPAELNEDPEFMARVMTVMADPETYPVPEPEGPTRELLLDAVVA